MGFFHVDTHKLSKSGILIAGFAGFGNVGYYVVNHLAETLEDLETIAVWGGSSWFHRGRLEAPITVYRSPSRNLYLLVPRIPFPVTLFSPEFYDEMIEEILSWNLSSYIVLGGLRESTRGLGDTSWFACIPSPKATKTFGCERSFGDDLSMIGPLSSLIMQGFMKDLNVLGLLAYCNDEDDVEASKMALERLNKLLDCDIPVTDNVVLFDFNFIPSSRALLLSSLSTEDPEVSLFSDAGAFDDTDLFSDDDDDDDEFL